MAGTAALGYGAVIGLGALASWMDGCPCGVEPRATDMPEGRGRGSYDTVRPDLELQPEPPPTVKLDPFPTPVPFAPPRPDDDEDKKRRPRLLFGQARIDENFSTKDGVPSSIAGKSIKVVAEMLDKGDLSTNDLEISYFRWQGKFVATNNRGLAAISLAKKHPTNMKEKLPSGNELKRLRERSVLGDTLPSNRIPVTKDRYPKSEKDVKFTVYLPD